MVIDKREINLITSILLFLFNITMFVFDKSGGIDRYINLAIPVVAIIFIFILKNKNYHLFYSLVGFLITGFTSQANFSGAVLFFMSVYDDKSKKNIILNFILIIGALCVNTYVHNYLYAHIFSMMIAFFFVFGHMYVRFWKVEEVAITGKPLTPEQKDTIQMLLKGLSHKDAANKLNIERKTYTARVASLRKKFNCKSDFLLAIELQKQGYLSLN